MNNLNNMNSFEDIPDLDNTTWWHKNGKDHFTVRDTLIDPADGIILTTTDGRRIGLEQLDNYIKSDEPVRPEQFNPNKYTDTIDSSILSEIADFTGNSSIYSDKVVTQQPSRPTIQNSPTYDIIDRALHNIERPQIKIEIEYEGEQPLRELELLHDIMNISYEEIADYYYQKWFRDDMDNIVRRGIGELISGSQSDDGE